MLGPSQHSYKRHFGRLGTNLGCSGLIVRESLTIEIAVYVGESERSLFKGTISSGTLRNSPSPEQGGSTPFYIFHLCILHLCFKEEAKRSKLVSTSKTTVKVGVALKHKEFCTQLIILALISVA